MEGRVDTICLDYRRWFTCPQTVIHPGSNDLTPIQLGVKIKPKTSRSQVQYMYYNYATRLHQIISINKQITNMA